MAEPSVASDSPLPSRTQQTPSSAQSHQRRNNPHNSRNHKRNQFDGAISDGPVINPAISPRSNKAQQRQRSILAVGAAPDQSAKGRMIGQKQRPASMNAGHVLATPAKEQAYAGPTFQVSPAPSSLPLPKCFSRSLPNNAPQPSFQEQLAGDKTPENPNSTPGSDVAAPVPSRESQTSPLDFFFQADRAEKERMRNGRGSLSPQSVRRPPPPRSMYQQPSNGVFLQELDDGDDSMPGRRTVSPRKRPGPAECTSRLNESDDERQAKTKSLKELLFSAVSTPPPSQRGDSSGPGTPDAFFGSPSPFQHSQFGPSTPLPPADTNTNYSLHYGNRNLSPLFKAARSNTSPHPSSLRQEVGEKSFPVDANTFARSYLQEQIRTSLPTDMPPIPFSDRPCQLKGPNNVPAPMPIPGHAMSAQHGVPGSDPPRDTRPDVRGMEDNLRRMLKIA